MDHFDDTLDQLKDASGKIKPNLHILQEVVPVEEQMKYFQYSQYVHTDRGVLVEDLQFLIDKLFEPNVDIEDRRYYLTVLAGIVDVVAYRAIETYHKNPLESDLSNWSAMALIENKVLLDAELSGEQQYYVSTGLGGQDGMLRFFAIITTADRSNFNSFQKDTLDRELRFALDRHRVVLEDFQVQENYAKILLLCHLKYDIKKIIEDVIKECNSLGCSFDTRFILTNLKKIEDSDICQLLNEEND